MPRIESLVILPTSPLLAESRVAVARCPIALAPARKMREVSFGHTTCCCCHMCRGDRTRQFAKRWVAIAHFPIVPAPCFVCISARLRNALSSSHFCRSGCCGPSARCPGCGCNSGRSGGLSCCCLSGRDLGCATKLARISSTKDIHRETSRTGHA